MEQDIDAPLDAVWALVADFANLDWFGGAERVEKVGEGTGQVRRIYMPGMDEPVEEELLAIDPGNHRLEYAVLEGGPNIMRDYRVVATLAAAGEGRTHAHWEATFSGVSVEGVEPADMIRVMRDAYAGMLQEIGRAAAG